MKIAIFTNAYKPILSGVVNTIEILRKAFIDKGHDVLILAPGYYDYIDGQENIFRYKWVDLTPDQKFPIAIPISAKADKIVKNFNPDIIHCHHPFIMSYAARHYAKALGVPLVFTFHTQYEQYTHYIPLPQLLVKNVCRNKIRTFALKCDAITTPANSIAELLKSYRISSQINVIPNAVDLESFNRVHADDIASLMHRYGLEGCKTVIAAGRIAPEKNLHFLIRAFLTASKSYPACRLMIVGDGQQLEELKAYAAAAAAAGGSATDGSAETSGDTGYTGNTGNTGKIIFTGKIDYNEMPLYYKSADIYAITSVTEVKPLTILEALAASLPVVAVSAPGASDTLTDMKDGLLTGHDENEFAGALLKLFTNEDLYLKLKTGALDTSLEYSADKISEAYLSLYHSLTSEQSRSWAKARVRARADVKAKAKAAAKVKARKKLNSKASKANKARDAVNL